MPGTKCKSSSVWGNKETLLPVCTYKLSAGKTQPHAGLCTVHTGISNVSGTGGNGRIHDDGFLWRVKASFTAVPAKQSSKEVVCCGAEGLVFMNWVSSLKDQQIKSPGTCNCHHCHWAAHWTSLPSAPCSCSPVMRKCRLSRNREYAAYLAFQLPGLVQSQAELSGVISEAFHLGRATINNGDPQGPPWR